MREYQIWPNYFFTSCLRKVFFVTSSKLFINGYILFTARIGFFSYQIFVSISLQTGANPIYNLLPDILGKLSNQNLQRESFCNIMQFLIGSIKRVMGVESDESRLKFLKLITYHVSLG